MKRIILFIFLGLLFIISGCANNFNESDLFNNKQKCASYRNNILKEDMKEFMYNVTLDSIFYSPIRKSCIYTVRSDEGTTFVIDYLTKETLRMYLPVSGDDEFKKLQNYITDLQSN